MAETETKRMFYNRNEAKGFTRAHFFQAVLNLVSGETLSEDTLELIKGACEYELDGIANRPKKVSERKDPLQSDYAKALREAIMPFVDGTPRSAQELCDLATAKGKMAPSGKAFSGPWVARVLKAEAGVASVKKIVEKIDSKGLKAQVEVNGFKRI